MKGRHNGHNLTCDSLDGDGLGVVFLPPPLEKKASKKRSHDEEESKGDDKKAEKKKQEDEPLNEVTVFGTLDKQAAVQKMAWATVKGERLVRILGISWKWYPHRLFYALCVNRL